MKNNKWIRTAVALGTLGVAVFFVWAAETNQWTFSLPASYTVYKARGAWDSSNTDIVVADGVANLVG